MGTRSGEEIMPYFTKPKIYIHRVYDGTEECTEDPDKCKTDAYEKHCDTEYERGRDLREDEQ